MTERIALSRWQQWQERLSSSALAGASPLFLLSLTSREARQLRDQLAELLDDPDRLPDDVKPDRVASLVVALTTALNGWLEP